MVKDVWSYEGKRVAIVGCASGMGEAAAAELARLGAEVHGFDIKPATGDYASFRRIDLRDKASIEAGAASLSGPIDALFNCAGLAAVVNPPMDLMRVMFIGLRHWTNLLIPRIAKGGAIASIASTGGSGWPQQVPTLLELIGVEDFDAAVAWCEARPERVREGYAFAKQACIVWTMLMGARLIRQGVRINCICPGPTDSPMMNDFLVDPMSAEMVEVNSQPIGRHARPVEQAYPLVFLNSDAASYINGHVFNTDGGFSGAVAVGEIDMAKALADAIERARARA
jgi:NAD(P)-dependent dehydrogenase (short-subunit alcohol dehydrogenase family)